MKASVLLDVTELLETAIAIRATIRFFARVDADVLHQLVVGRKRLETLLALVRLRFAPVGVPGVHLHRRLGHENLTFFVWNLREEEIKKKENSIMMMSCVNHLTRNVTNKSYQNCHSCLNQFDTNNNKKNEKKLEMNERFETERNAAELVTILTFVGITVFFLMFTKKKRQTK